MLKLNLKNLVKSSGHIAILLALSTVEVVSVFGIGIPARMDLAPMYRFEQLFRVFDFPWDYKSNLGSPVYYNGNIVYNVPLIVLSWAFKSVPLAHIVYLVLLVYVCGHGFYKMLEEWTGCRLSSLIGSTYMLFSWVYYRLGLGHNTIIFGTAILPYLFLASIKYLKTMNPKLLLLIVMLMALLAYSSIHVATLAVLMILILTITEYFDGTWSDKLLKTLPLTLSVASLIISLTPVLLHLAHAPNLVNVIREEESGFYTINPFNFTFFDYTHLILGVLAASIYLYRGERRLKDKKYYMPIFLISLGLLLSFGGNSPIGSLYNWLFVRIPGFVIFREATKFLLLSAIGMSIMVGSSFKAAVSYPKLTRRVPVTLLLLLLLGLSSQSSYKISGLSNTSIPEYWIELDSYLWSDPTWYRIAYLPPATWATNYRWEENRMLDFLVALQPKPTLEIKSEMDITLGSSMVRWLYTRIYRGMMGRSMKLLELFGVRYLIYRPDAYMPDYRDDLKIFNREEVLTSILSSLRKDPPLNPQPLQLYVIEALLPHLYLCEGFTLIAGGRDTLITLANYGWDFKGSVPVFADNLERSNLEVIKEKLNGLIIEGTSILPLTAALLRSSSKAITIEAWRLVGSRGDPRRGWVLGDFVWWYYEGDMLSHPGRYLLSNGSNVLELSFKVDKEGIYSVLLQSFTGPKELGRLNIQVDNFKFEIDLKSQVSYKCFRWFKLPSLMLKEGKHTITIRNQGDAALSQIILVEESMFEKEAERLGGIIGEDTPLYYLLEDKLWAGGESVNSGNYSLNSGVKLNKPVSIQIDILRSGEYLLDLFLGENLKKDLTIYIKVDDQIYSYRLNPGLLNYTVGPVYFTKGEHLLCVEAEGNLEAVLDFAVLRTGKKSPSRFHPVKYDGGGSTYKLSLEEPGILVFLENYSESWILYGPSGLEAPHVLVLGFANAYLVEEAGNYTLRYRGYDHLLNGLLIMAITLPSMLVLALYPSYKWKNRKESSPKA